MQDSGGQVTEHQKSMLSNLDLTFQAFGGAEHGVQDQMQNSEAAE